MTDERIGEDVGLLLKMGNEAGGRVDPARFEGRDPRAASTRAFRRARAGGLLDERGFLTPDGYRHLGRWLNG